MNPEPAPAPGINLEVAERLREMAALLQAQGDEGFRARAYRAAADKLVALAMPVSEILAREGLAGLDALPTVGPGIAAAIAEIVQTGRWSRLERLRGAAGPEAVFLAVPGIGPTLATRLHEELGLDSLEALEVAAHDGRLGRMRGVGARRAAAIRAALAQQLQRRSRPWVAAGVALGAEVPAQPPVQWLLEIDREYREAAAADRLPKIAPRRFNPAGLAWLPVLHARRGEWHFTALFSNTARAHAQGRVRDWVVIYAEDAQHHERPYTVITAGAGRNAGRRIVAGREPECGQWYRAAQEEVPA